MSYNYYIFNEIDDTNFMEFKLHRTLENRIWYYNDKGSYWGDLGTFTNLYYFYGWDLPCTVEGITEEEASSHIMLKELSR